MGLWGLIPFSKLMAHPEFHTGPIFASFLSTLGPLKVGNPKSRCFDVTEFSYTNFTNFNWLGILGAFPDPKLV